MIRRSEKTYSTSPVILRRPKRIAGKQRYCIVCNGERHINLNYATSERALKEAAFFVRTCYKDFIDFQGNKVSFSFRQV